MRVLCMAGLACAVMVGLLAFAGQAQEGGATIKATRLQCEYRDFPLGVDSAQPRLSWVVDDSRRGARQTAFQILVSSSPDALEKAQGDLWDSGKVESDQSIQVVYAGAPLDSRQVCHWKVRLWDAAGAEGPWSSPQSWGMGFLKESDWQGKYIGLDPKDGDPGFPWLRKEFDVNGTPKSGKVYVNPLGYFELYINGGRVSLDEIMPAQSQFSKRSFYLTYDVAGYLKPGKNCIALWMGHGWYAEGLPGVVYKGPLVRAQLEWEDDASGRQVVATGTDWKAQPSPITGIGDWAHGRFGGQRFEASRDTKGRNDDAIGGINSWNEIGYNDSAWPAAAEVSVPAHTVSWQPVQPNRIQRRYEPLDIRFFGERQWLIDFGTNLTGSFSINLGALKPGQEVTFDYYDMLGGVELDNFDQHDIYVASGVRECEEYHTQLNYHAFRYVKVTGLDAPPAAKDCTACLIHTDYPIWGSFMCSDPMLNRVHDMVQYTLRCLSMGGNLVDCPHIERLGYGGDGQASTPTAFTMFGAAPMYTTWLAHWRDCQRPDGGMPHTAPNPYPAGGGPFWCGFIIAASWELFQQCGDRRMLETNYPSMQLWLDTFVESWCKDDVLQKWPDTDYRGWYLGDWARPGRTEKEAERSVLLVNNCFRIQCYDWMARIAGELGKADDQKRYQAKADALRPIIHTAFYDPARNTYADDTQLDLAYPLLVGVVPEVLRGEIMKRLEDDILVKHEGHLDVGLVGVPLLTTELTVADRNDLLYAYTSKDTFPGWGYMLRNGATTTWEHWDAMRSRIHNCYNGIGVWFYRGLAGIRPDPAKPGYKHFTLRPAVVGGITSVDARQDTVSGAIESAWRVQDGKFEWNIQVPANTSATVMLPTSKADAVTEAGKPLAEVQGLRVLDPEPGRAVFELEAGRYAFSAPM